MGLRIAQIPTRSLGDFKLIQILCPFLDLLYKNIPLAQGFPYHHEFRLVLAALLISNYLVQAAG